MSKPSRQPMPGRMVADGAPVESLLPGGKAVVYSRTHERRSIPARWLVDGYNVIRSDPDLHAREGERLELGRAALHRLLVPVAQRLGDEFVVVFDGARPADDAEAAGQVRFVFSRPPETADDVVMRLAAQWREGAIVVSSDRTIRQAASRGGSPVLTVAEFLSGLHAEVDDVGEDDDDAGPRDKRGNPRRLSREERAARRALRRLRG